jgi:FK506-binding nuclear protein
MGGIKQKQQKQEPQIIPTKDVKGDGENWKLEGLDHHYYQKSNTNHRVVKSVEQQQQQLEKFVDEREPFIVGAEGEEEGDDYFSMEDVNLDDYDEFEDERRFWGLTVKPGETYSQCVERPVRLTLATLDPESAKPDMKSRLMIKVDEFSYTLCTLVPDRVDQQSLDLMIGLGEDVSFWVTGENPINLLGYYEDQTPFDYPYLGSDDDDEEVEGRFEEGYDLDDDEEMEREGFDDDDEIEEEVEFPAKIQTDLKKGTASKFGNKPKQQPVLPPSVQVTNSQEKGTKRSIPIQDKSESSKKPKLEATVPTQKDATTPKGKPQQQPSSTRNHPPTDPKKTTAVTATATTSGSETSTTTTVKPSQPNSPNPEDRTPKKKVLPSGLEIEDLSVGTGPRARAGKRVSIRYIGRLEDGTVFDKNTNGTPFSFNLGKNEVIKGWDMGIQGMAVGGQRKLVIPPGLVSSEKGGSSSSTPNNFPKNSKLQFEIKLLSVE